MAVGTESESRCGPDCRSFLGQQQRRLRPLAGEQVCGFRGERWRDICERRHISQDDLCQTTTRSFKPLSGAKDAEGGQSQPIKDLWVSGEFMMRLRLQQLQLGSLWDSDFCTSAEEGGKEEMGQSGTESGGGASLRRTPTDCRGCLLVTRGI